MNCTQCGNILLYNPGTSGKCQNCLNNVISVPYVAPYVQKGWQCPCCSRVWSPFTAECQPCNAMRLGVTLTVSGQGGTIPLKTNQGDTGSGSGTCHNSIAPLVRNG